MSKTRVTKTAKLTAMLRRKSGANLETICKATGWQTHSVRAAISGLRKAGHKIERTTADGSEKSVYRIIKSPEAAS